jgi:hypothetical protein
MAGITLEIAQKHLNAWLEAELIVTTGQSYTIGSRVLTRANLTEIRNEIDYWNKKVVALDNAKKARGRNRVWRIVPRDL